MLGAETKHAVARPKDRRARTNGRGGRELALGGTGGGARGAEYGWEGVIPENRFIWCAQDEMVAGEEVGWVHDG